MDQISGGNLLAMRSLATQSKDSAATTLGNMDALVRHYVALQTENIKLRAELADMSVIRGIDDRFGGRLALMLECAILNPNGYFDEACALLDEYKAEWEKVNPSPPTFMGEPIPNERLERLREMTAKRGGQDYQALLGHTTKAMSDSYIKIEDAQLVDPLKRVL